MTRIIFMGTPDFAVPTLNKLHQHYQVVGVVTQPDRRSGRGRKLIAPPVKQAAEAANLPLFQPASLRKAEVVADLQALQPDLIVVAAFGQILRPAVLNMPPHGCINVHASLLPRWRGAAPIQAAIRAGDAETGVTIMQMDAGLDTGPMLAKRAIPIAPAHTGDTLTNDLAQLGAELLIDTLPDWLAGRLEPQLQNDGLATLAPKLEKQAGQIDWQQSAVEIERQVRAFDSWPGTFTTWQGVPLKILTATADPTPHNNPTPGQVIKLNKDVAVVTGSGVIRLQQIQLAGKKALKASDFVNGNPTFMGSQLS